MLAANQMTQTLNPQLETKQSDSPFKSPTIGKLAEALAKAQSEIRNAAKDKDNPFFKSTYADLASVWDACREPLAKNDLSVTQPLSMDANGRIILNTLLLHKSGEWILSQVPVIAVKQDPQGIGSAITYFRRFSLSSIAGIAPSEKPTEDDVDDDDDGNAAAGRNVQPLKKIQPAGQNANPAEQKVQPKNTHAPTQNQETAERKPSEAQFRLLFALSKQCNTNHEQVKAFIHSQFGKQSSKDLSLPEFDYLVEALKSGEVSSFIENQEPASGAKEPGKPAEEKGGLNPNKVNDNELPWNKYMEDQPSMLK